MLLDSAFGLARPSGRPDFGDIVSTCTLLLSSVGAVCCAGVLHGAILAVLHRGVHRRAGAAGSAEAPHAPVDHVLALAVFLLRVAAERAAERAQQHHVSTLLV